MYCNKPIFSAIHAQRFSYGNISLTMLPLRLKKSSCWWKKYEPRHEKTNNVVSKQVQNKPGCTSIEAG